MWWGGRRAGIRISAGSGVGVIDAPLRKSLVLQPTGDCPGRCAERARDPQIVARPRPVATQGGIRRHFAEHRDAKIERTSGGVAADQLAVVGIGKRKQSARKPSQPALVDLRQCHGQRKAERARAHRGQVRQIDRERFVAQRSGIDIGKKMPALDQHVGGDRDRLAGPGADQGTVVADAKQRPARAGGSLEEGPDQLELAQRHRRSARRSARTNLGRPRFGSDLVKHAIDVLETVGATEGLGKLDRLVDDDPIRNLEMTGQLVGADQQRCMLDR